MTPRELQALILATPECALHIHTPDMPKIGAEEARAKDQAVLGALVDSGALMQPSPRKIGVGDLLGDLGVQTGTVIYQKLVTISASDLAVELALSMLKAGTLDIGHHETVAAIDALPEPITAEEKAAMKAMAIQHVHVSAADVSIALRGPWGSE